MKYNVGDKVRIKSIDWYYDNRDRIDEVACGNTNFIPDMTKYCKEIVTISAVLPTLKVYHIKEDGGMFNWTDEMIEGIVEEEIKPEPKFKVGDKIISDVLQLKWKVIDVERTGYKLMSVNNSDLICDMDFKNEHYYKLVEEETEPKFKVGDKIKLKSTLLNDIFGVIGYEPEGYRITNISNGLTYFMSYSIEHCYELVEEEVGLVDIFSSRWVNEFDRPKGYIFKDENGNEIHALKIVLEKANTLKTQSDNTLKTQSNMETETHRGYYTTEEETINKSKKVAWFTFGDNDFADKVELDLSNRELIQEDGKWFVVKKKKEYPKTYEECRDYIESCHVEPFCADLIATGYKSKLIESFARLYICRDAYWQIAGEEMGLGKPWEPSKDKMVYSFYRHSNEIETDVFSGESVTFEFPTAEMRDAFYENFKDLIEECKELL